MMGTVKPQKFGSAASRATDGLKPCLKILRDMIGMPSVSPVQGDLSKVRGLFWNHGSLALTTIYFPLIHTRLSAPGSRDSGVIILRAMSGPVQVEQGQIRLDLAKGDAIFMPSDVPLSLSLPEGGVWIALICHRRLSLKSRQKFPVYFGNRSLSPICLFNCW